MWLATAGAAEIYIEGPAQADRAEVVTQSRSAKAQGYVARVVRRHDEAAGWTYLVRVEGFTDKGPALTAAVELAPMIGGNAWMFEVQQDGEAVKIQAEEVAQEKVEAGVAVGSLTEEYAELQRVVEAHGGVGGGMAALSQARTLRFEFRRTLSDGSVIDHIVGLRGGDQYVEVIPVEGEVAHSRTVVLAAGAWLGSGEEALAAQDRDKTVETLADLTPDRVIPFVLGFGPLSASRDEFRDLELDGESELDGTPLLMLKYSGDRASSPLQLEVEKESALVRRVTFDDGAVVHEFDDWGELNNGIRVPGKVRTRRDGVLVDTIEVKLFELNKPLPEEWFEAP
jgi:hypothetical protein